jgi:putative membrane protein
MLLAVSAAAGANEADQKFIEEAVRGNLGEIEAGREVLVRTRNEDVKEFGEMLVTDHTKALEQAQEIAKALGVMPPTEPSEKAKESMEKLEDLTGAAFEREFLAQMVQAHRETIDKYEAHAEEGDDERVAEFIEATLPVVKHHLETAQELQRELVSEVR